MLGWNIPPCTNSPTEALWYRTTPWRKKKYFSVSKVPKKKLPGGIPSPEVAVWQGQALNRAAKLQVHVCIFIGHVLTLFHLPQNNLFQSWKTHLRKQRECLSLLSWLCLLRRGQLWSLGTSDCLCLHTKWKKKRNGKFQWTT